MLKGNNFLFFLTLFYYKNKRKIIMWCTRYSSCWVVGSHYKCSPCKNVSILKKIRWGPQKRGEWFGFWTDMDGADHCFWSQPTVRSIDLLTAHVRLAPDGGVHLHVKIGLTCDQSRCMVVPRHLYNYYLIFFQE